MLVPYVKYQRMLDMSHKKPISSVSQLPRTTLADNGSKKKKPKVVTGSPRKTTLSVEKKTNVPSDTIVKPPRPGKCDKQLAGRISTRLGHMNTFKDSYNQLCSHLYLFGSELVFCSNP